MPLYDYLNQLSGLSQQYLQPEKKRSLAQALMAASGAMVAPAPRGQYNPGTLERLIGAGNVGMGTYFDDQRQQEADQTRKLLGLAQLGRYGMEQQEYMDKLAQQEAIARSRAGILGRLSQPGGYEDTTQQMSIPTPSPMEQMTPMQRAYLESELYSANPNLAPLLKTTEPPKISGYKTVDESGKPTYLTEFGQPTGIEAYVSPREVEPYKVGTVREFTVGDRTVYKTYKGNGQWEDMKGVGGGRYKTTGGGIGAKASDKYQKDVEAYKKEVAGLEMTYQTKRNAYPTNSRADIIERNEINKWYAKERDAIVKKYRGKIDFVNDTNAPTTNLEKKMGSEWIEGGRKFRINPQTGKKEMWVE